VKSVIFLLHLILHPLARTLCDRGKKKSYKKECNGISLTSLISLTKPPSPDVL
jgi:hypothetical protein